MLMISKLEENIVRGDWCYTLFQTLGTDNRHVTIAEFLEAIINSRHHFWQGDKDQNGMTWTHSDDKGPSLEYKNVKTFGFYDNNEIRPSDYKAIDIDLFESRLSSYILQETGDEVYEFTIRTLVQSYKNQSLTSYQFLPERLERSKFSVYTYFIAFILVNSEMNRAIRVEFGQD